MIYTLATVWMTSYWAVPYIELTKILLPSPSAYNGVITNSLYTIWNGTGVISSLMANCVEKIAYQTTEQLSKSETLCVNGHLVVGPGFI